MLTIWWCPCVVFFCVVGRGCLLWPVRSLGKTLCPASFCIPKPNLPVTPGVSWLPTFAFQSPIMKRTSFLGVLEGFGEGNGTPLQYSCLENPMDGGAWWAAVHGVAKSRTWLSDFTFSFHFHALEKEMATHSSVLAWRIPGTGEPGGLPSLGLHRVGHDWSDLAAYWILIPYWSYHLQIHSSHSLGCLFTLLMVSFALKKL